MMGQRPAQKTSLQGTATPSSVSLLWWAGLLLLHAVNVIYYAGFTIFYKSIHQTNLLFKLHTYSIGIPESEHSGVALVHAILASVHLVLMLLMVGSSLAEQRLVFYPTLSIHTLSKKLSTNFRVRVRPQNESNDTKRTTCRLREILRTLVKGVARVVWSVVGRDGILGVDSLFFDDVLVVRELGETALQTYQAYRMTQLLPRLGLIRLYVAVLVANCWSVPLLHRVYRNHHYKRHLASLLCDAVLDTVSSLGIQVIIFITFAPQYNDARFGFPTKLWFLDEWLTSVYQEFQMMLVVSWGDMASRVVFAVGLLQCMDSVKDILVVRPNSQATVGDDKIRILPVDGGSVGPRGPRHESTKVGTWGDHCRRFTKYFLHAVVPRCFMVWGVVVLGIHIFAEARASTKPCKLPLRPWLKTRPACSLVDIDCHELGLTCNEASLESEWSFFDPQLTAHVTIRHCPRLVIPQTLQRYHRLVSIKVYNSTISSWPATAALTADSHAALRAIDFVRSNFVDGKLPPGLLTSQFPQSLRGFGAIVTNLGSLPSDLHHQWPERMLLSFEYCQFTAVPQVIMDLKPEHLSFAHNRITSVPASLLELPTLVTLFLSDTLLQELPRNVTSDVQQLALVAVGSTNVSVFWSWMDPIIGFAVFLEKGLFYAYDTPFCRERSEIEAGTRTGFSFVTEGEALARVMDVSTPDALAYSKLATSCKVDPGVASYFPLAQEDAVSTVRP